MSPPIDRRLSVAPMMECTDRHERFFLRLITTRTLLYTEMVTAGAVLHGDRERLLAYDPVEHPLALQVGGSSPTELAKCARIAHAMGYDEVNLNVGCPSGRVQSGRFGACLMAEPDLVASCVAAMADASPLPVTVKTRIGIDERDSFEELLDRFVPYVEEQVLRGVPLNLMARHLAGLFHGEPGAKLWRRRLGELCRKDSRREALRELVAAFPAS
ncbi:MAG: tRNA-dihydrouridine synthase [Acidobacteriota bacterium]